MWRALGGAVAFVFICVIVVPALVVGGAFGPGLMPLWARPTGKGPIIRVRVEPGGKVQPMALEDYVKGVVAAEMPAEFELEALKAQAVVARTLAVRRMRAFGGSGLADDPTADVSTDPARDQAWASIEELRQRWGAAFNVYWAKVGRAVAETEGMIITYNGLPIDAQFHSTSAGPTENSEDVWSEKVPYLRSVPCDWDRESPYYTSTARFTLGQIEAKLPGSGPLTIPAATGKARPVTVIERTATGRVKTVRVGSKTLRGIDFRLALGLKSTNFTVGFDGDEVVFQVKGYGHGVGLCQYGANGLAKLGRSYEEIIKHYYTGVTIEKIAN